MLDAGQPTDATADVAPVGLWVIDLQWWLASGQGLVSLGCTEEHTIDVQGTLYYYVLKNVNPAFLFFSHCSLSMSHLL